MVRKVLMQSNMNGSGVSTILTGLSVPGKKNYYIKYP